ncbi:MAG: SH3 domain-containing protein [Desulfomonile sp.]|nr:SH3 domain-containing protein [Desulfomonile sp.]
MPSGFTRRNPFFLTSGLFFAALFSIAATGCQDVETIKREVIQKFGHSFLTKKQPFIPRDGITIRPCSLYQTANPNSEVVAKLPAETTVHLTDKVGEWYRVRTREGREGYLDQKMVGGEDIIRRTNELRRSIEGVPVQAEGVIKSKANFRLDPGRNQPVLEVLPPGKKFEMYERVVTLQRSGPASDRLTTRGPGDDQAAAEEEPPQSGESADDTTKKDVWYKVKVEDGRVGYVYTHNLRFTPPEDIARQVPFMRLVAWRPVGTTDDPDYGAKNNYVAAYAPIGKDPGCDYTRLYFMSWSKLHKRLNPSWQSKISGVLPITDFHYEGKPGFSVRSLHPTSRNKLVLTNFYISKGRISKAGEEEIRSETDLH